jgi:hypothetical protein
MTYITAPAFLASALVNGDLSGLQSYGDKRVYVAVRRSLKQQGLRVIDVCRDDDTGLADEPRFTWQFPLYGGLQQGGEVINYQVDSIY